jgi:hypothetical protein
MLLYASWLADARSLHGGHWAAHHARAVSSDLQCERAATA